MLQITIQGIRRHPNIEWVTLVDAMKRVVEMTGMHQIVATTQTDVTTILRMKNYHILSMHLNDLKQFIKKMRIITYFYSQIQK